MRFTILVKLLVIMLIVTIVPLVVLGVLALGDTNDMGSKVADDAREMGEADLASAQEIGDLAVNDSRTALDSLAKEAIEVRSVVAANTVADFLHERDGDVLAARNLPRTDDAFRAFLDSKMKGVIYGDTVVAKPIYKEIAYLDANGDYSSPRIFASGYDGKDYALEGYKSQIATLENDQIWVSTLWGDYVGIAEAYAGVENPTGQRYEGYFRWVTPVYTGGVKQGYISLKLDARHVMELVQHISPTAKRFVNLADAPSGNYAYLVDCEGWLITHAREYHLKGVLSDSTLVTPLNKGDLLPNTKPLQFGYLRVNSVELDEIHTVHTMNGESGSQVYPWAGLVKWIAYSVVPYHTGSNYQGKIGFGWVGVGAEIGTFHAPADQTAATISGKTEEQAADIETRIAGTENSIHESTDTMRNAIIVVTAIMAVIVVLVTILFARTLTKPIKKLRDVAQEVSTGNMDVTIDVKSKDEIGDLAGSFGRMVAAVRFLSQDQEKGGQQ